MTLWYWILFFTSAIAYGLPFLCESLWWFVFFFPILFFYVALNNNLTFLHGYIWGIVSWSIHLGAPLYGVMLKANGPLIYKLIPIITILLYLSAQTGVWFWATHLIMHFFYPVKNKHIEPIPNGIKLILLVCSIWGYLFFVSHWSLSLFNRVEGCFIMNPLILLAAYPPLLYLLPPLGTSILLFLLLTIPASIIWFFNKRTVQSGLIVLAAIAPWIFSIIAHNFCTPQFIDQPPPWTAKVVYAPVLFCCPADTTTRAGQMAREIVQAQQCNDAVELIIFPESCLYGIYDMQQLCTVLYEQYALHKQKKNIHILCGGFSQHGTQWHNVFYWLHQGKIRASFCKRHAVTLAEALPIWFRFSCIMDCYFPKIMPEIAISDNKRPKFFMQFSNEAFTFIPYICSELFCNRYPDDTYSAHTYNSHNRHDTHDTITAQSPECIIEIANDTWAIMNSTKRLMLYSAIFKAIAWQRNILYISYYYGVYINTYGTIFTLNRL